MKVISITDHKKHNVLHFYEEMYDMLDSVEGKTPLQLLKEMITEYAEKVDIKPMKKESTMEQVLSYISKHKIITTGLAKQEGIIIQSNQLQQSIDMLRKKEYPIKVIDDRKPYIYFMGISNTEARRLFRELGGKAPVRNKRVSYGNAW